MIRLGAVDFDTSHVVEFTRRLNRQGVPKDQWVEGAEVVVACPGESRIMPERIPGYKKLMRDLGVPLVDDPREMIGKVDGVLVQSQEGGAHWAWAKVFLDAGLPCFVDKPFTCSVADARKIRALARKKKVGVFSSSSLRYAEELFGYLAERKRGELHGALAYGPAPVFEKDARLNPGLYHYGIHAVEILYTLMGPGCQRVSCTHEKGVDVVTGQWKGGRVATVRGDRPGKGYGFVAFAEPGARAVAVGTKNIYRDLLKQVVAFFKTGRSPVDIDETVEIVAFIEAANRSAANHGAGEKLAT